MPHKSHTRHKVEMLADSFILLDSLLFKLITVPSKEKALLAIPESCVGGVYHWRSVPLEECTRALLTSQHVDAG